jgi:hypothetical protein
LQVLITHCRRHTAKADQEKRGVRKPLDSGFAGMTNVHEQPSEMNVVNSLSSKSGNQANQVIKHTQLTQAIQAVYRFSSWLRVVSTLAACGVSTTAAKQAATLMPACEYSRASSVLYDS